MSTETGGREQDQGRRHRRAGRPNAETRSLLEQLRATMRTELRGLLAEIAGTPDPQLALDGKPAPLKRPSTAERGRLWELALKLGRELGEGIDLEEPGPVAEDQGDATPRRRKPRPDFGPR